MSRRRRQSEGSLDSLLDTMTNVVGILVILLAVTQINVGDAIKRVLRLEQNLAEAEQISVERLAALQTRVATLEGEVATARGELSALAEDEPSLKATAEKTASRIEALRSQMADMKSAEDSPEAAAARLQAQRDKLADAKAKISELQEQLANVQARLGDTPKPQPEPPKQVTLPNPRPAPPGIAPLYFICKGGRIMPVPLEGLRKLALRRLKAVIDHTNEKGEVDCERMVEIFKRSEVGNADVRLDIKVANYRPYLEVLPREGAGEPTQVIEGSASRYRAAIFRANPKTHYARFLVWPDSYETYVAARRVCEERDMLAGWVAFYENQQWRTSLGVSLTCEGKPPPPPKPDKPATGGEPKPPPKKLPADTVD